MGTNYYLIDQEACPTCGREGDNDRLHIGKSSVGWCFSLHVIPEEGLNSLDDWKQRWPGKKIVNDYGDLVSEDKMLRCITERSSKEGEAKWERSPAGYESWAEFHRMNGSKQGPNGLVRHRSDSCWGPGTWDLISGDFS